MERSRTIAQKQWPGTQVDSVVRPRDPESLTKLAGSIRQQHPLARMSAQRPHELFAQQWLDGTYEHCAWIVFGVRHQVDVKMHSVDEEHIGEPGRAPHDLVALGATTAKAVRCTIPHTEVRLGFHDAPRQHGTVVFEHQKLSQYVFGDDSRGARVETAWQGG